MGLSRILNLQFNSSVLRFILSLYYKPGKFYRIPFGALKGFSIWYDRTINFHAILGVWEKDNFDVLMRLFPQLFQGKRFFVVYDIGANIGLFSLYFSKFQNVQVIAFEAVPATTRSLENNLVRNNVKNVVIVGCAVSSEDGEASFFVGHHHKSSLLKEWASSGGSEETHEIRVPSVKLDSYWDTNPISIPDFIKIDVEGGAGSVLQGASKIFRLARPVILIESHNPSEDNAIMGVLNQFNYDAFRIDDRKWVINKSAGHKDRDGVWGTLVLLPEEKRSELAPYLK
jgi:FkbM family methyltransferase